MYTWVANTKLLECLISPSSGSYCDACYQTVSQRAESCHLSTNFISSSVSTFLVFLLHLHNIYSILTKYISKDRCMYPLYTLIYLCSTWQPSHLLHWHIIPYHWFDVVPHLQPALIMIAVTTGGTVAIPVIRAHPVRVSTREVNGLVASTVTKAACCLGKWVRGI